MIGRPISKLAVIATTLALLLTFALAAATASAARDRQPPTTPTNLRVTAMTSYSVSLAWNPSTDNSGKFSYVICCATTSSATVSHPATNFTFTTGVEPGWTHSFRMYAVDAAGNKSKYSNTVTVTVPPDRTPPTAPTLSVTDIGPTHVSLAWTPSTEDGPYVWYQIYLNGSAYTYANGANATSATILNLTPETTYTFAVRARDSRINWSPLSNTVSATTEPSDPNDATPPTPPTNLTGFDQGCGEADLRWTPSTDNVDPQFAIRYEVFVNGIFRPESTVTGYGQTIAYAEVAGSNTFEIFAIDSAGNRSTPAAITLNMSAPC
ncbi:MAG TPA: fibronectin type III domain-containing protein [Anaerolineae bacterium]|nr:fibronectin type III domain-containing protein [Anaerolineae bacterium]